VAREARSAPRGPDPAQLAEGGRDALASAVTEEQLERARSLLARSHALAPGPGVAFDQARAEALLGTGHAHGDRRVELLHAALEHAELALRGASPGFAGAHAEGRTFAQAVAAVETAAAPQLALMVCALDAWSRARGIPTFLGQRQKVREGIERLVELDPSVLGGAPWRLLGTWLAATPAAAGGDLARSREAFEKALAAAPAHLENRVALASTWAVKAQDRTLFETLLGEVIAAPAEQEPVPENAAARARAGELLARVDALF
jgi:hypothetical protein